METNFRPLYVIAQEIYKDWSPMNEYAKPYANAMLSLISINDRYILDSGREIVGRFLNNASSWKGDKAREIKKELNQMLNRNSK